MIGDAVVLFRWTARLRGLIARDQSWNAMVVLVPCGSIHTFGMRASIDVAFFDARGRALASFRGVPPNRRLAVHGARFVCERFAREEKAWFLPGQSAFRDFEGRCCACAAGDDSP